MLALAAPATCRAHVGHVIVRAERYLKLDVAGRDVRVVVSLTLGEGEGLRVLTAADTDADGRVTRAEADAYLAEWGAALVDELPLEVDGEPVAPSWGEGFFEPTGPVRRTALTVEMVARFTLGGGEQTVRLTDRMVRREVFERTDVAFEVRDGAALLASGVEGDADEPRPDLAYGGSFRDGAPVPLVARLRTPEAPPEEAPRLAHLWIGAAAFVALTALVVVVRRRRRGRATGSGKGS
ncbi:MAG: hypothetical protein KF729_04190 [Sandaracinaceae bacterium]|nr:hypothetical protein [Sandaracinaceae bacterium]